MSIEIQSGQTTACIEFCCGPQRPQIKIKKIITIIYFLLAITDFSYQNQKNWDRFKVKTFLFLF